MRWRCNPCSVHKNLPLALEVLASLEAPAWKALALVAESGVLA